MNTELPWWVYPTMFPITYLSLRAGIWIGEYGSEQTFQEKAVKAGVSYWTNSAEGKPSFVFKESQQLK